MPSISNTWCFMRYVNGATLYEPVSVHVDCRWNCTCQSRVRLVNDVMGPLVYEAIDKDMQLLGGSSMLTEWGTYRGVWTIGGGL